jgi:hypothetical protein
VVRLGRAVLSPKKNSLFLNVDFRTELRFKAYPLPYNTLYDRKQSSFWVVSCRLSSLFLRLFQALRPGQAKREWLRQYPSEIVRNGAFRR